MRAVDGSVPTVPNLLSPEHCAALIERRHSHGHERLYLHDDMKRRTGHRITDDAVWKRRPILQHICATALQHSP